jgi:tRNA-2-methylthio-N6-dimethylallyladenosine synthase
MAETPSVMPQLHMPLQSGSDRILKAMKRSYRSEKFLGIIDRVRATIPHAAISTDIIVGFPGETEQDFEDTLLVVRKARFATAFTFQYSVRPGTPAATMPDQVPQDVVQERFERLMALQDQIAWEENHKLIGTRVSILVATNEGKKDSANHRMSGRAEDSRLVHFTPNPTMPLPRPGDVVDTVITQAKPFFLLADSATAGDYSVRKTRAGDAYDRWQEESCGAPTPRSGSATSLGMPTVMSLTTPLYDPSDNER